MTIFCVLLLLIVSVFFFLMDDSKFTFPKLSSNCCYFEFFRNGELHNEILLLFFFMFSFYTSKLHKEVATF